MPNWCTNRVEISGEAERVQQFKKDVASEESIFDFNKIIPMPPELDVSSPPIDPEVAAKNIENHGFPDWYHWRIVHWGTKWNIEIGPDHLNDEMDHLTYRFDTAWAPPQGIYDALVKKYPDLYFSWFYDEPDMELAGYLTRSSPPESQASV